APEVRIEVYLAGGLPRMNMVGLPEAAVRESRDRVRAAIRCAQFEFPQRAITINLAPADLPKDGGRFDLPIALGILAASGQVPVQALAQREFLGELGLTGELRAVDGVLPAALAAAPAGRRLVVPMAPGADTATAKDLDVRTARTLREVCAMLGGSRELPVAVAPPVARAGGPDMRDVRGQLRARRALEIAAAGGHHLLLVGPPGCGKTLLASRLPGLLPEADEAEALETAAIASVSGRGLDPARWRERPYRSPHHTASAVALVGGGGEPRPGEISLAHNGVLFLDELPEWDRRALEVLREPLESGVVTISRAARPSEFPARFQLVAAMHPSPCGSAGEVSGGCRSSPDAVNRYRGRISGPRPDRIELHWDVPRLPPAEVRPDAPGGEPSAAIRTRVEAARALQLRRAGQPNARLGQADTMAACRLSEPDQQLLEHAIDALQLSARAMHRILRVARTIADLAGSESIATAHLTEALGYRGMDARHSARAA